ncbi:MAG TPA: arginine deiminase-related protein [Sphingobacteriaceae bacterium]|nr:arginine deiminase-related protein [Sphingobacteriaceae bacterium]
MKELQSTSNILMIRPVNFAYNEQTAGNNAFQNRTQNQDVQDAALSEFDEFVKILKENEVNVMVINDTPSPHTPDSVFPNNWISFHADGSIFLYPMQAENRRLERKQEIIDHLKKDYLVNTVYDLSYFEKNNRFLEGTGSLVLDRENKIAYACISPRTDQKVLNEFCLKSAYSLVYFNSVDGNGMAIYHTNVMMCIGSEFSVVCLDSVADKNEKEKLQKSLTDSGKEIIEISLDQMNQFAGNMLQLSTKNKEQLLVMSNNAYKSLLQQQISRLEHYCKLVYAPLDTIESTGGGSARCMIAEIHLPEMNTEQPNAMNNTIM